jgi:hypothetical protein
MELPVIAVVKLSQTHRSLGESLPVGLKPASLFTSNGTAETVPFPKAHF